MSVTITMPQLGETVTEGTILAWVKQIGEYVAEDDILVEISTDKVDTEIPSPAAGVLTEILFAAGSTIDVGTPIAVLSDEVENARKLAAEHGIDLAMVTGTGDGGRITRGDIESFASELPSEGTGADDGRQVPAPPTVLEPAGETDVREIGHLRRLIAKNMSDARQVAAHVWTSVEVDYERVEFARNANRDAFMEAEGFPLTYLPFIARATMEALSGFPVVNSQIDFEAGTHAFHRHVNLGLAIDLDQKGLIVANIPGTDSMTLRAIARSVRATADAAHGNRLGPDDLAGFTFSITNPGPYGSFMSAPIIPPPNAAILSTETIKKRPVVVELPDGSDGIAIHHIGYLGLSWDHRVFDGSTAALFLNRIKENLETWDWEQELR